MARRHDSDDWGRRSTDESGSPSTRSGILLAVITAVAVAGITAGVGSMIGGSRGWFGSDATEVYYEAYEEDEGAVEEEAAEAKPRKRRRKPRKPKKKPKAAAAAAPAPAPAPKPKKVKPSIELPSSSSIVAPRLPSDVDTSDVRAVLRAKSVNFKRCIDKAVKAGEMLKGVGYIHMTINGYGKAEQVNFKDSSMDRSMLGRCVVDKLGGGGYPAAEGGPMTVTFPLRFIKPD